MDVHPDAVLPALACTTPATMRRTDASGPPHETAAELRARLLKMIVASENSRKRPPLETAKPR